MSINVQKAVYQEESLLARHKVLRQTYMLLGANLLFSALCAYVGVLMGGVRINPIIMLVMFFGLSFGINAMRNSGWAIILLFALTGLLGFSVSFVLNLYISAGLGSVVVKALIGTGIIFFALSAYVLKTGTDFTFLGGFLFVAMLGAFLLSLGAMLFGMSGLQVVMSGVFLLVFSGYVLYDTSNILQGHEDNYIIATLNLFLNIYNIFISLLNILGATRD